MFLIVGLGNPGKKYEETNHNVGFNVADSLVNKLDTFFSKKMCKAVVAETFVQSQKVLIAKPQTYMNLSGESVREFVKKFKIPLSNVLVVSDDIDLDVGVVRFREKGSAGTHNGLKSIVECLGSGDFKRIRVGIGRGDPNCDLADFVLSNVSKTLKPKLEEATQEAVELIVDLLNKKQGE